mmetsp:Transcript_54816/g.119907  ORF Transcript_54816/g.119907 Transcript_54816/m.119907 type:complete len:103 (-) Transcript_54816:1245-1553(-)
MLPRTRIGDAGWLDLLTMVRASGVMPPLEPTDLRGLLSGLPSPPSVAASVAGDSAAGEGERERERAGDLPSGSGGGRIAASVSSGSSLILILPWSSNSNLSS